MSLFQKARPAMMLIIIRGIIIPRIIPVGSKSVFVSMVIALPPTAPLRAYNLSDVLI